MFCRQLAAGCVSSLRFPPRAQAAPLCQPLPLRHIERQRSSWQKSSAMLRSRTPVVVKAQAAAQSAPVPRHAFLHDFCMCIPYGAAITVCGLAMKLFGGGQTALLVAVAGSLQILLSSLSLKVWRARQKAVGTLFTALEAGISGGLTYHAYQAFQAGAARIPHAVLGLLSALMTLFLAYNILAGGNPPPKEKAATAQE